MKRCSKPGCGAFNLAGHPCTDGDCPQQFVHHTVFQEEVTKAENDAYRLAAQRVGFILRETKRRLNQLSEVRGDDATSERVKIGNDMLELLAETLPVAVMALVKEVDQTQFPA